MKYPQVSIEIFWQNCHFCSAKILIHTELSNFFNELFWQPCRFLGAPDKPSGVGRADANPKLLLNDT